MRILLIQDNPDYVKWLEESLSKAASFSFEIDYALSLSGGLLILQKSKIDIVFLELSLSDSYGLESFHRIHKIAPTVPVVILTAMDDELLALQAVRDGAQDYLLKGELDGKFLSRVIRYSIERQLTRTRLEQLSFTDELTSLYNRRGFLELSKQQMKLSIRNKSGFLICIADVDGLKQINDRFGHLEGDRVLKEMGSLLRKVFRNSDILARIGGDEFSILAIDAEEKSAKILRERLKKELDSYHDAKGLAYPLRLSLGAAYFNPKSNATIEELMEQADKEMYEEKHKKSQFPLFG